MLERYDFKLIKSGKEIEVYDYKDKKIIKGYTRGRRTIRNKTKKNILEKGRWSLDEIVRELEYQEQEQTQKTKFSISRTRTNIRRIANSNSHLDKFLTLTFAQPTTELTRANKMFNTAIKRIVRAIPTFEYIAVVEFQKDTDYHGNKKEKGGSVHYHLLCNIHIPDNIDIFAWERRFAIRYWKNGFVKIKKVNTITNMGAYFCKYLSKDMFDKRMFGKKKFFCSQTLKKPIVLTGKEAEDFRNKYLKGVKPVYEKTFTNEHTGEVEYRAYTLKEDMSEKLEHDRELAEKEKHYATTRKACKKISKDI